MTLNATAGQVVVGSESIFGLPTDPFFAPHRELELLNPEDYLRAEASQP